MAELTPMMRQYFEVKKEYPDCILFYRMGDFFEMFHDDARVAARELDLALTSRDRDKAPEDRVPMCGVPHHAAEGYIARLIQKGYKVAICEQTEDPKNARGLVSRDVVRIVTPGTLVESSMLTEGVSNYLAAVCIDDTGAAAAFTDVSTGEFYCCSFAPGETAHLFNELGRFSPREAVLSEGAYASEELKDLCRDKLRCLFMSSDNRFDYDTCLSAVLGQFNVPTPDVLGLEDKPAALRSVGAVLSYLKDTRMVDLTHLSVPQFCGGDRTMELDIQTFRNLELTQSLRDGGKKGSLLWAMDRAQTPMGRRMIRSWVSSPLLIPYDINRRLSAVDDLYSDSVAAAELSRALRDVGDMERVIGKIVCGAANCRDLITLSASIHKLPELIDLIRLMPSALLGELRGMDMLYDIADLIDRTICDEPPISVRDGGMIRPGFSGQVDHLRSLLGGSKAALAGIETRERERTGKKLKVGYNKVFGYYIEIPRSQSADVPDDYIRKQTLVNCERFITEELKDLETELLSADDDLKALEYSIYSDLIKALCLETGRIQETGSAVAALDVLTSFALCARSGGWVRPEIYDDGVIDIRDGRHPVVEASQPDTLFVPNDTYLDRKNDRAAIITGPNMAGKSTYMRQTALIVMMAQMGSFVPARSAHIGIVDRVFTRIGASDDLAGGKSTFMVEMTEVAEILKTATPRSLIILDEVGRGTSTYDGMAIARAVLEHCADEKTLGAKTMFATHYHELTALEAELPGVKNYNISAKKRDGDIIFLRKIIPGGADDSYGIEVAHLAGVPDSVIKRANTVLRSLVEGAPLSAPHILPAAVSPEDADNLEVLEALRRADMNTITPIEALNLLFQLKKKVKD